METADKAYVYLGLGNVHPLRGELTHAGLAIPEQLKAIVAGQKSASTFSDLGVAQSLSDYLTGNNLQESVVFWFNANTWDYWSSTTTNSNSEEERTWAPTALKPRYWWSGPSFTHCSGNMFCCNTVFSLFAFSQMGQKLKTDCYKLLASYFGMYIQICRLTWFERNIMCSLQWKWTILLLKYSPSQQRWNKLPLQAICL